MNVNIHMSHHLTSAPLPLEASDPYQGYQPAPKLRDAGLERLPTHDHEETDIWSGQKAGQQSAEGWDKPAPESTQAEFTWWGERYIGGSEALSSAVGGLQEGLISSSTPEFPSGRQLVRYARLSSLPLGSS